AVQCPANAQHHDQAQRKTQSGPVPAQDETHEDQGGRIEHRVAQPVGGGAARAARQWRSPLITGAAQQVHIMLGMDSSPPVTTPPASRRPSQRSIQRGGSNTWMAEPSSSPSSRAFQMASP